jgi:hypothetical protein
MNVGAVMPALLLLLFGAALIIGAGLVLLVMRLARMRQRASKAPPELNLDGFFFPAARHSYLRRPSSWLVVKSRNVLAVQSALGLHNAKPCSWSEGIAGEKQLFISPPVKGWILVVGSGLPDPGEDADTSFRFVVDLSRKLGQVQFFSAGHVLHHHAWVRAEGGRVLRAFAWAGKTVWKQGVRTRAEMELGLRCPDYDYPTERTAAKLESPDTMAANSEKVPALAARWSLDPADIDERFLEHEPGISGEASWRY